MLLAPDSKFYEVSDITGEDTLELATSYDGATVADQPYALIRALGNNLNAQLADEVYDLLHKWWGREVEYNQWITGTVTGGPTNNGEYPLTQIDGTITTVKSPARQEYEVEQLRSSETFTNQGLAAVAAEDLEAGHWVHLDYTQDPPAASIATSTTPGQACDGFILDAALDGESVQVYYAGTNYLSTGAVDEGPAYLGAAGETRQTPIDYAGTHQRIGTSLELGTVVFHRNTPIRTNS